MKNLNEISLNPLEEASVQSIRYPNQSYKLLGGNLRHPMNAFHFVPKTSMGLNCILSTVYEFLHITDFGLKLLKTIKGKDYERH